MTNAVINDEFFTQFCTFLIAEKRVSANTVGAYRSDVFQYLSFLVNNKKSLHDATIKDLRAFLKLLKGEGREAKSLARKISALKLFYNFLHERHNFPHIAKVLICPKIEKTLPSFLTESEVERLLSTAQQDNSDKGIRNKVMLYLAYASGLRVSELVNLTFDQVHFDTGFISINGKGNKERMVPLPKSVMDLIRFYKDSIFSRLIKGYSDQESNKHYCFPAIYKGSLKPLSRQLFWMWLKKILEKASISKDISPHSLRHSFATHFLKNGADLRSLQLLLGHQNLSTVQVYTHVSNSYIRTIYDKKHPRA